MRKQFLLLVGCMTVITLVSSSCKKKKDDEPAAPEAPTLYERVGGTEMVADPKGGMIEKGRLTLRAVVDSSINVIAADDQMAPYFATVLAELGNSNTTGLTLLSKNFTDFMCIATGSKNDVYTGKNMKDAHDPATNSRMGMKVDAADFDRFVGHIGTGLAKNGVTSANSPELVADLVALLNTTKADIVQR